MKKTIFTIIILAITFYLGYQFASFKTQPQKLCEAYYKTQCTKNGELPNGLIPYSQVESTIYQAFENSTDTWYISEPNYEFFTPNLQEDNFQNGRCFTPEAEKLLLQFYPKL